MTEIGTPIIQSTADRMTRLLNFAKMKRLRGAKVPLRPTHAACNRAAGRSVVQRSPVLMAFIALNSGTRIDFWRYCFSGWQWVEHSRSDRHAELGPDFSRRCFGCSRSRIWRHRWQRRRNSQIDLLRRDRFVCSFSDYAFGERTNPATSIRLE